MHRMGLAAAVAFAVLAFAPHARALPAAVVIDARNGDVLLADNADTRQSAPALPKLMTVYLMFEAFEAGTVKPDTNLFVTATAAAQPQPSLGLREFDTIRAGEALNAVLAASANDAAAVLAEFLEGSVPRFVEAMNAKAGALDLPDTRFANITGAPDPAQYSTPRDMIRFSLSLMRNYPERAKGLVGTNFAWQGKTYEGPQTFLGALSEPGAGGINRARGATARGRDVVAVIWNADDAATADRLLLASLDAANGGGSLPASRPAAALASGAWGMQLGAFSTEAAARARLDAAARKMPALASAKRAIQPVARPSGILYRATYQGIDEAAVRQVCETLRAGGEACLPVSP